jgi:hypothetical protein
MRNTEWVGPEMKEVLLSVLGVVGTLAGLGIGWWLNQHAERQRAEEHERQRRRIRAEETARMLMDACNEAYELSLSIIQTSEQLYRADRDGKDPIRARLEELRSQRRRQTATLLTRRHDIPDPHLRTVVKQIADCFTSYNAAHQYGGGTPYEIIWQAREQGTDILGAYLRDEPLPDAKRLAELSKMIHDYYQDLDDAQEAFLAEEHAKSRENRNE